MKDILNAYKGLDEVGNFGDIKFYTLNPEALPKYEPESVSLFAMMDRLHALERQHSDISEAVLHNIKRIADLCKPMPTGPVFSPVPPIYNVPGMPHM